MTDTKTPDSEIVRLDNLRENYWVHRILHTGAEQLGHVDSHSLRVLAKNAIGYMDRIREQHNLFAAELARRAQDALRSQDDRHAVPKVLLKQYTPETLPLRGKPPKLRPGEPPSLHVVPLQP